MAQKLLPPRSNTRVLNTLQAVLEMVTADADASDPASLDDAEILLAHFARVLAEGRSVARDMLAKKIKDAPERERRALADELEKARILGKAPEVGPAKAPAPVHEPSKEALERAEKLRTPEPRKVEPPPPDADTAKAIETTRKLHAQRKAQKK